MFYPTQVRETIPEPSQDIRRESFARYESDLNENVEIARPTDSSTQPSIEPFVETQVTIPEHNSPNTSTAAPRTSMFSSPSFDRPVRNRKTPKRLTYDKLGETNYV